MKRFTSSGTMVWPQPITVSGAFYPHPMICEFTDDSFALSWWDNEGLNIQRYNHAGTALWSQPTQIFAG
ncbi:MAG: hypothetical protein Q8J62_02205 [Candidatus Cloacimonadaceae bacterium]|nr:hypothetical protein [Candidatus Cloacimonadaceae bacterium]